MNNQQLIEKVLYYIDKHIYEELTYERLAEVFGYSSFHFHKIFSSVTELSITEYIRKRRLTMAHKKLCETTETVADICYSVGFHSIQTFNRVFKDTFGMQPLAAREKQAKSWFELKSNLNAIERKNEHTMYGFEDYSEEFRSEPLAFYYMAGVEVDKNTILPEGVYRKVVPKAKYAVFVVNGNNADGEIWKALRYIYSVWLPNSEYCIEQNTLFDFEYYDERWDCQFGAAQMEIYIPVKKMEC